MHTAEDTAERTARAIGDLPANFMLDSATYDTGNSLGFDGVDFYVVGRGGALGDVSAGVVAAAFVFFNPAMIHERWERGIQVMAPSHAALAFAGCLHAWSQNHLPSGVDYARLAELTGKVVATASPAGAPLFAGWLTLPEPTEARALALHRINALRELRGALHGGAVLAAGLDPRVALLIKTPFMAAIFGWEEPHPDVGLAKDAWGAAEAATNRAMSRVFAALDAAEQAELIRLLDAAHQGVH
ncbi:MAG TPA: hypothetical protein VKA05_07010 [Acidimicrobiales bacterium]|nr:hypothetical protein [Acidimicrobiales bacterium]